MSNESNTFAITPRNWLLHAIKQEFTSVANPTNNQNNNTSNINNNNNPPPEHNRIFKKFDFYGYAPVVQFESLTSSFGGFVSLFAIFWLLIYIIFTCTIYFTSLPVRISTVEFTNNRSSSLAFGISFQPSSNYDADLPNLEITDPEMVLSLLSIRFRQVTIYYGDSNPDFPRKYLNLPTAVCNFSLSNQQTSALYNSLVVPIAFCPGSDPLPPITGTFNSDFYQFLSVTIGPCTNTSTSSNNNSSSNNNGIVCSSPEAIKAYVESAGVLNLNWYETTINSGQDNGHGISLAKDRNWKSLRRYVSDITSYNTDVYVRLTSISANPYYPSFNDWGVESTSLQRVSSFDEAPIDKNMVSYYVQYNVRMDQNMDVEVWKPELDFLTMIAGWGAIWSTLSVIFGTIAFQYNRYKYKFLLKQNTDSFVAEYGSTEEPEANQILNFLLKKSQKARSLPNTPGPHSNSSQAFPQLNLSLNNSEKLLTETQRDRFTLSLPPNRFSNQSIYNAQKENNPPPNPPSGSTASTPFSLARDPAESGASIISTGTNAGSLKPMTKRASLPLPLPSPSLSIHPNQSPSDHKSETNLKNQVTLTGYNEGIANRGNRDNLNHNDEGTETGTVTITGAGAEIQFAEYSKSCQELHY